MEELNQLAEKVLTDFYNQLDDQFGQKATEINGLYHSICKKEEIKIPKEIRELVSLDNQQLIEQVENQTSLIQLILLFYADKLKENVFQQLIFSILLLENNERELLFLTMTPHELPAKIIDMIYIKLVNQKLLTKYTFGEKDYRYHLLKRNNLEQDIKQELVDSYEDISEEEISTQIDLFVVDRAIENRKISLYKSYNKEELNLAKFNYACSQCYIDTLKQLLSNKKTKRIF